VLSQWGDLLVIVSVFFWAGHIILISSVTQKVNMPFQLSFIQSFICFVLALCFASVLENPVLIDFVPAIPELIVAGF
mgnify:CR=1